MLLGVSEPVAPSKRPGPDRGPVRAHVMSGRSLKARMNPELWSDMVGWWRQEGVSGVGLAADFCQGGRWMGQASCLLPRNARSARTTPHPALITAAPQLRIQPSQASPFTKPLSSSPVAV